MILEILEEILVTYPNINQTQHKVCILPVNKKNIIILRLEKYYTYLNIWIWYSYIFLKLKVRLYPHVYYVFLTSTIIPLTLWLIFIAPTLITKSFSSNRGPLISTLFFLDVYTDDIFNKSKSNNASATTGTVLPVPLSRIANTDAGCSELWNTCNVRWTPERTLFKLIFTNIKCNYNNHLIAVWTRTSHSQQEMCHIVWHRARSLFSLEIRLFGRRYGFPSWEIAVDCVKVTGKNDYWQIK